MTWGPPRVKGNKGPNPANVWSLKRTRPGRYCDEVATPGVVRPGGHRALVVASEQTVPWKICSRFMLAVDAGLPGRTLKYCCCCAASAMSELKATASSG